MAPNIMDATNTKPTTTEKSCIVGFRYLFIRSQLSWAHWAEALVQSFVSAVGEEGQAAKSVQSEQLRGQSSGLARVEVVQDADVPSVELPEVVDPPEVVEPELPSFGTTARAGVDPASPRLTASVSRSMTSLNVFIFFALYIFHTIP